MVPGTLRDHQGILKVDFMRSLFRSGPDVGPSNRGTRVAESKSTIGIDRGMISEEMLLWLESRAGVETWDPQVTPKGPSRDLQGNPQGPPVTSRYLPGIPRGPQGTSREPPGTAQGPLRDLQGPHRDLQGPPREVQGP